MKLSKLLATRQALLRQTQLANVAHAYITLRHITARITAGNLHGLVKLRAANPADECYWPSLIALEGNQSVIEEHFADHELIELADAMALAVDDDFTELDFRLEELAERFVSPLHHALEQAGVIIDSDIEHQDFATDNADST